MTVVSIEVDLGENVEQIRERIVAAAARQLLVQTTVYNDEPHSTKLAISLGDDISRAVRGEIQKVVGPAVRVALEAGVQPTDNYGTPKGEKVPLRDVIIAEAEKALHKKVEFRDNYNRSETLVQAVIRDEVQRAMAEELKAAIKEEKVKVQEAVRGKAAEILTESVRGALR